MQQIIDGGTPETREATARARFPHAIYLVLAKDKTSIPVASVRSLITQLATTSQGERVVWVPEAEALTHAAQNTLLKILEEPPTNTHFIFGLNNYRSLLSTILSRCQRLHLASPTSPADSELLCQLKRIMQLGPAGRLNESVKIGKDRETALAWFQTLLASLATTISTTTATKSLTFLGKLVTLAETARSQLTKNGNVTLVRDHFFLSLPKTK